jgi:uncharacterized membrane protein
MKHRHLDDQKVENLIANLLRAGVVAAAFVVISGAIVYLGGHPRVHEDYRTFRGEPEELRTVHGIVACAFTGNARCLMQLGLLLLIATPVARVIFSAVAFAIEGDRMYVAFTLLVLAVLLYSLFGFFWLARF